MVSKSIESAQKRIEGLNFDTRKHVLEFDDVLNHQRNTIYRRRRNYVAGTNQAKDYGLKTEILEIIKNELSSLVAYNFSADTVEGQEPKSSVDEIIKAVGALMPILPDIKQGITEAAENAADREFAVVDELHKEAEKNWEQREAEMGKEIFEAGLRFVALQALDSLWMEHLDTMSHLRDSVRLRGYGQRDPLVEYKKEGFKLFQNLIQEIDRQIVYTTFKVSVEVRPQEKTRQMNLQSNRTDASNMTDATDQNIRALAATTLVRAER